MPPRRSAGSTCTSPGAPRGEVAFTPPTGIGDWEIAQRHAEMVVEISNLRNIFGFGRIIGGEGGGFAIMAAGVQFALEKIAEKREEEAQPLRMPGPRYRPNAA